MAGNPSLSFHHRLGRTFLEGSTGKGTGAGGKENRPLRSLGTSSGDEGEVFEDGDYSKPLNEDLDQSEDEESTVAVAAAVGGRKKNTNATTYYAKGKAKTAKTYGKQTTSARSKEMESLRCKFADVDEWEMEFEDVTVDVGALSSEGDKR